MTFYYCSSCRWHGRRDGLLKCPICGDPYNLVAAFEHNRFSFSGTTFKPVVP